jgi:L-ascorbate metabolism protein UlaG (beta-lactamase superfamily)
MVRRVVRRRSLDTHGVTDGEPTRVTFLGHSSLVIDIDGQRIVTDPILRPRVGPLRRTTSIPRDAMWSGADAVLISHSHWDHLDIGSLRLIGRETTLIVPQGLASRLNARGFHRTVELLPGEHHGVGSVRVEATHAEHRGFGPPVGGTDRSIGFLVQGSSGIYFAGDTAYFEGLRELDVGLDLALMPVWGWGPMLRSSEHLDPLGAARAVALIRPRWAVPIHWGTLHPVGMRRIRPSTRIDPPHQFAQLVRRYAPDTRVRVLGVGATLDLPNGEGSSAGDASVEP